MTQDNIFDNIRNEILQCNAPQSGTSTSSKKNKFDIIVEKIFDLAISSAAGLKTNLNFVKGLTRACYNFAINLDYWCIKNLKIRSDLLSWTYNDLGGFINSPKDLNKRYNLLMNVTENLPQDINYVLECINELSLNKYNNADSVKHVFKLCDKIKTASPKLTEDVESTKAIFFERVCSNNPQQGMIAIVNILEKYPTQDDLSAVYSGILSLLESSNMKKELYPPLIKILKICNKSGYNTGLVRKKFNRICMDIHAKDKNLNIIELLKDNAHRKQLKPNIEKVRSNLKEQNNSDLPQDLETELPKFKQPLKHQKKYPVTNRGNKSSITPDIH